MRRLLAAVLTAGMAFSMGITLGYAEDSGDIDLYEAFSSQQEKMKNEVGSRIYKWSMHLPDDAIIYKSERVNYFDMYTSSYSASVSLDVQKNEEGQSLEDILYNMQMNTGEWYWWGEKEFSVTIEEDDSSQRYIRIVKAQQFYDYYMVDEAAEELGEFIENRIYVANGYIYNLTVSMDGKFYRGHEEMFDKLTSSFKPAFDEENPKIKELSESYSVKRVYENTSYGWQITIAPYWKLEDVPNARYQSFAPVYTDEELEQQMQEEDIYEYENERGEGVFVNLMSSANEGETASGWAKGELQKIRDNYNEKVYDVIEEKDTGNGYGVTVRYNTVTNKPYVVKSRYIIGNGYKYIVSANIPDEKYSSPEKRKDFEEMMNSFSLKGENMSRYLGHIVWAESLINLDEAKELKTKKYDCKTTLTKAWMTKAQYYDYYHDYSQYFSSGEEAYAFEPNSNIHLKMASGINTSSMGEIKEYMADMLSTDDDVRLGLVNVSLKSASVGDAQIFYMSREYDIGRIRDAANQDEAKVYDLGNTMNQYRYIIKINNNMYTLDMDIPVANTTKMNLSKVEKIWMNTQIGGQDYPGKISSWTNHTVEELLPE
ncbi:hypothetical protein SAMN02745945_02148 [Peptoclostridium litorale DSM 5388]|uniref:Uncharacterized protein n=1 Tax=Peptoclostridium litorale DSM 5388 TaxID=1121324 RepID=A0A069REA8_PEPLI|nr:hypothetical protein [Peptoclostridium litorale]KDR95409.1 hypothetical protein CLIT_10c01360 [Peptoclostridium litorale DSM 5388]SIO19375.1 hypothetical protein SAMN02745945_02148 [Peptoclostridium litorale DSM 5388]